MAHNLNRKAIVIARISGILVLLVGFLVLFVGFGQSSIETATKTWYPTQGTVTSSEIIIKKRVIKRKRRWHPQVMVTYQVNGHTYTTDKIYFTGGFAFRNRYEAKMFVSAYPIGSTVTIYVDRNNPKQAALRRGGNSGIFLQLSGAFLIIIGASFLVVLRNRA